MTTSKSKPVVLGLITASQREYEAYVRENPHTDNDLVYARLQLESDAARYHYDSILDITTDRKPKDYDLIYKTLKARFPKVKIKTIELPHQFSLVNHNTGKITPMESEIRTYQIHSLYVTGRFSAEVSKTSMLNVTINLTRTDREYIAYLAMAIAEAQRSYSSTGIEMITTYGTNTLDKRSINTASMSPTVTYSYITDMVYDMVRNVLQCREHNATLNITFTTPSLGRSLGTDIMKHYTDAINKHHSDLNLNAIKQDDDPKPIVKKRSSSIGWSIALVLAGLTIVTWVIHKALT